MLLVLSLLMLLLALTIFPQLLGRNGITFAHAKFIRPNGVTPTPSPTAVPGLTYYGGPVIVGTMNVYPIYWFPNDNGANNAYIAAINQFYSDVHSISLFSVLSEYPGHNGIITSTQLAGSWEDMNTPYPETTLTQADIVSEVKLAIATNNWPTSGYNNYFPVYTLKGEQVANPQDDGSCGAHYSWGPQDNPIIFAHIAFASAGSGPVTQCAYLTPTAPSGSLYIDTAITASAHEQFEAATDPLTQITLSWYAFGAGEIGDICQSNFGPTPYPYDGGLANQRFWNNSAGHYDYYIIQTMASSSPLGCSLGT
ncbi:MAG TPA: hypothetical protein VKU38_06150 [Ktedonobacteraceae bacterium]|nr:hypothetical protein [Ktedonobacteraceae bacterium]